MRYPKLRELKEAIKALIKGPYTSRFPFEPHTPYERFRGRPYFHEKDCTGCTACAQVCPTKAIDFEDDAISGKRRLTVHWDICIFCGQCQANCLTGKGILLSQEYAFATIKNREALNDSVEKEFVFCECCQEAVLPHDQYMWLAKRLGPLSFSNSSLIMFYLRSMGLALKSRIFPKKEEEFNRADRIKILCPRCRRKAVLGS